MSTLQVFVSGLLLIGAILAMAAVAMGAIWWVSLVLIRRVPMIGKRHRHADWDRLNGP